MSIMPPVGISDGRHYKKRLSVQNFRFTILRGYSYRARKVIFRGGKGTLRRRFPQLKFWFIIEYINIFALNMPYKYGIMGQTH